MQILNLRFAAKKFTFAKTFLIKFGECLQVLNLNN